MTPFGSFFYANLDSFPNLDVVKMSANFETGGIRAQMSNSLVFTVCVQGDSRALS